MPKKEPIENDCSDSFSDLALDRHHPDSYPGYYIVQEETEEGTLHKYYNSEDVLFSTVLTYIITSKTRRPYLRRGTV